MNYFDIAILVIVFIFVVMGFRKGLVAEVVGILGIIIALFLAVKFSSSAAEFVPEQFNFPPLVNLLIGFVLVFGGIIIFFKLLTKALQRVMHPTAMNWLDKTGGIALGAVEGTITASVLIFLFSLTPLAAAVQQDIDNSLLYEPVETVAPELFDFAYKFFPLDKSFNDIKNSIKSKLEGSTAGSVAEEAVSRMRTTRPSQQTTNRSTSSGGGQRGRK